MSPKSIGSMAACAIKNHEPCEEASESGQLPYRTMRLPYEVNLSALVRMAAVFIEIALLRPFCGAPPNWLVRKMIKGIAGVLLTAGLAAVLPLLLVFEIFLLIIILPVLLAGGILHTGKFVLLRLILDHAWRRMHPVWWKHGLIHKSSISRMVQGPVRTAANFMFALNVNAQLVMFCKEMHVKADVIYCHDLYTLQAGCVLKEDLEARLIYDSHEYYPCLYEDFAYVHLIKWYQSTLVRRVDVYITVSPQLALELQRVKNEVRDRLEDLAVTYGLLGKSVFILPPVTEKDLIGGAKEADLGLIPYKSDRPHINLPVLTTSHNTSMPVLRLFNDVSKKRHRSPRNGPLPLAGGSICLFPAEGGPVTVMY